MTDLRRGCFRLVATHHPTHPAAAVQLERGDGAQHGIVVSRLLERALANSHQPKSEWVTHFCAEHDHVFNPLARRNALFRYSSLLYCDSLLRFSRCPAAAILPKMPRRLKRLHWQSGRQRAVSQAAGSFVQPGPRDSTLPGGANLLVAPANRRRPRPPSRSTVRSVDLSARAVCVMARRPQQRSARRARQGQKKPRRSGGIRQMRCCCSSCRHFSLVSVTLGMPHPLRAGMVPLVYAYLLCHGVEGQSVITPTG